jgi:hypothetical protein
MIAVSNGQRADIWAFCGRTTFDTLPARELIAEDPENKYDAEWSPDGTKIRQRAVGREQQHPYSRHEHTPDLHVAWIKRLLLCPLVP